MSPEGYEFCFYDKDSLFHAPFRKVAAIVTRIEGHLERVSILTPSELTKRMARSIDVSLQGASIRSVGLKLMRAATPATDPPDWGSAVPILVDLTAEEDQPLLPVVLNNVRLGEVLALLCKMVGLEQAVEDGVVVLRKAAACPVAVLSDEQVIARIITLP